MADGRVRRMIERLAMMACATSMLGQPPGLMSRSHHSAVSRVMSVSVPRPEFFRAGPLTVLTPKKMLALVGSLGMAVIASAGGGTAVGDPPVLSETAGGNCAGGWAGG